MAHYLLIEKLRECLQSICHEPAYLFAWVTVTAAVVVAFF